MTTKFRINKGNLASMNSFLTTTTDHYIARIFSGDSFIENPKIYVSVLYEIMIDIRLSHSVPFAELFSMRAGFRIGDTYEENRYLWTVKLILTTEDDKQ
jgi:hypothetical protein